MHSLSSKKRAIELQIRVLRTLKDHGNDADDRFAAAEELLNRERELLEVDRLLREEATKQTELDLAANH